MARNNLEKTLGENIWLELGNGATPEVFTRILLLNTSTAPTWTNNIIEDKVPNLDNFADPYDVVREVESTDFTVSGEGKLDMRYFRIIKELFNGTRAGQKVNCKFVVDGEYGLTDTGLFVISEFSWDAPIKGITTCSMTWLKAGELTTVYNTP